MSQSKPVKIGSQSDGLFALPVPSQNDPGSVIVLEHQISNIQRWKQQQTDTEANTFEFERIKQLQG